MDTLDNDRGFDPTFVADVRDWHPNRGYDFVVASPPCERFSVARIGYNWTPPPGNMPKTDGARDAVQIALAVWRIIQEARPTFFVIENPVGKLRTLKLFPRLVRKTVALCQYGARWKKPTDLWGGFPPSWTPRPVCRNGAPCHESASRGAKTGVQGTRDPSKRAMLPYGLGESLAIAMERDWKVKYTTTDETRPRCAKCDGIVDPMGVNPPGQARYCRCVCRWPLHGCLQPIYFLLNANQRVQPFDYGGTPHHATCAAFRKWKADAKKEARPPGVGPLEQFLK